MKDLIRMNQLAGIITESQARKMMQILNENEDNALSPKMQKQFNMIVSAIKNAKSEKDIDRIHTNLMLLPKKLTKIFINKLVNMGLADKEGDGQYSLSYDDGLDEAKKMMKILNENLSVGQAIKDVEGEDATILKVSTYDENKKAIDRSIAQSGWEPQSGRSKEELTWYLVDNGDMQEWYDEEELSMNN